MTGDADLARQVIARDDDVDRLFAFVSRGFYRGLEDVREIDRLGTDRTAAFRDYRFARSLERIADHATGIATVATQLERPPQSSLANGLDRSGAEARTVVDAALAGETDRAHRLAADLRETMVDLEGGLTDYEPADAVRYGTVLQRIRRTAENGTNIATAATESSLGSEQRPVSKCRWPKSYTTCSHHSY